MLYWVHLAGIELLTLVVIGTDGIGSCKSSYHTITAMTAPLLTVIFFANNNAVKKGNLLREDTQDGGIV